MKLTNTAAAVLVALGSLATAPVIAQTKSADSQNTQTAQNSTRSGSAERSASRSAVQGDSNNAGTGQSSGTMLEQRNEEDRPKDWGWLGLLGLLGLAGLRRKQPRDDVRTDDVRTDATGRRVGVYDK